MENVEPSLLADLPIYQGLNRKDLEVLAAVTRLREYRRGESIFREGDPSDKLLIVLEGLVKITKTTPSGREVILHVMAPGDPIGGAAVYDELPYPGSAVALDHVACAQTLTADLFKLLERHPSLVRGLLKSLTRRLVELTSRLTELSGGHVEERLARVLFKLACDRGSTESEGVFIPMPLSRQELADLTGTTIETCIRIMSRWAKTGLVETRGDGFLLRDVEALERIGAS
jgi:CRP/FNR family transcriptional regulator